MLGLRPKTFTKLTIIISLSLIAVGLIWFAVAVILGSLGMDIHWHL